MKLKFLIQLLLILFAFSIEAQVSVTTTYNHDVYNQYSFSDALSGTANDTTAGFAPYTKGAVENIFSLYSYTDQANDSVYIKIYREIQAIDGKWTNTTLVGIDSLGGAKVWSDTLAHNFLKVRYVLDGSNSTAKKNGLGTTYSVNVLNARTKKIKLE